MPKEKQPEFTVNDRRKFTSEGEPLPETGQPETTPEPQPPAAPPPAPAADAAPPEQPPAGPSAQERQQNADQYERTSRQFDSEFQRELDSQGQGHKASDFEITFEKFAASLYMTALVQLGLVHEQGGQPQPDLIGARQTIDTLSLIAEKTRGNLTPQEEQLLTNCLYELRMAYIEVTNALTRPPSGGGVPPDPGARLR